MKRYERETQHEIKKHRCILKDFNIFCVNKKLC